MLVHKLPSPGTVKLRECPFTALSKSLLFTVTVTGLHTAPRDDDTCNFVKLPEFITLASAGHRGLPASANGA